MARRLGRTFALAAALLIAVPAFASADPPPVETFTYTGNLQPLAASLRPGLDSSSFNTDLAFWGNKAYQGTYKGFRIIDVSNPANPTPLLNDYTACPGNQGDIIVWDNLLVRSWNGTNTSPLTTCDGDLVPVGFEGFHVFNVSNPSDPDLVASVPIPGCGSHTATGVPDLANGRLLVYNSPSIPCLGIDIVEVPLGLPATSKLIGHVDSGRSCHDIAVILGQAMLAACAGGNGFTLFTLGGPEGGSLALPKLKLSQAVQGVAIGHAISFSWDGSIIIFGHEPGGGVLPECEATDPEVNKTLFFFRATDGAALGRWVLPRPQSVEENCTLHNFNSIPSAERRTLVMGNYQAGISVLDYSDVANVTEIAYADPAPLEPAGTTGGDWSSYWYNGTIFESDITRGLITWKLNDPATTGALLLDHQNPQTQELTIPFSGKGLPDRPPARPFCKGKIATVIGTPGDDRLDGTSDADVIVARGGNDIVLARGGDDLVCGRAGADRIRGQGGRDRLFGERGRDRLFGGKQADFCKGGRARDTAAGCEQSKN